MKTKPITGIILTMFLIGMLTLAFNIQPVKASGTIYIRVDDSVNPPTAPIRSSIDLPTRPLHVEGRYIKDDAGDPVILRGVNQPGFVDCPSGFWRPDGGGIWSGIGVWDPDAVAANLDAMKLWGMNVVRGHQTIRFWINNEDTHYESGRFVGQPYRQNVKDVIRMAGERGMYYIFDLYNLKGYGEPGYTKDPMPFPPYTNNTDVIPNEDAFVEYWRSVAEELKEFPNVIFEIYNEPVGIAQETLEEAMADWHRVWQKCIEAIRSTGADQLIIVQWDYGTWVNLDYPDGSKMDWVDNYPFNDPLGNLVYSTHIYRDGGSVHRTIPTRVNSWEYDDLKLGYQYMLIEQIAQNHPVIIGEIGANMRWTGEELERELAYFNNSLTIFNEWNLSYTAWVWTVPEHMKNGVLQNASWIPPPNEAGQILINKLDKIKPTADAGQSQTVNVGETVTFDAGGSTDNIGIVSYEWDFGDGTTDTGITTDHVYTESGTYEVILTVKDSAGNIDSHSITITVFQPFFETPLGIATISVVIIAALIVTTLIILKRRKAHARGSSWQRR